MGTDDARIERLLAERLPRRLGLAMRTRGMSQTDLARASGLSKPTLSLILAGGRLPHLSTAVRLADTLDVSIEWLLGMDVRPNGCLKPAREGQRPFAPGRVAARRRERDHGNGE